MDLHLPRGLPARHAHFLCLLAARPSLTRADYQRLLCVAYATAKRDLAELAATGLILPLGSTRTRRYALSPLALLPKSTQRRSRDEAEPVQTLFSAGSPASDPHIVRITVGTFSVASHNA
jgi:DeoR/GlpR family transcriptional regulator of sugar metabolism